MLNKHFTECPWRSRQLSSCSNIVVPLKKHETTTHMGKRRLRLQVLEELEEAARNCSLRHERTSLWRPEVIPQQPWLCCPIPTFATKHSILRAERMFRDSMIVTRNKHSADEIREIYPPCITTMCRFSLPSVWHYLSNCTRSPIWPAAL